MIKKQRAGNFLASLIFLGAVGLTGCGGSRTALSLSLRDSIEQGKFKDADQALHEPDVLSEQKNRLLTLMELGVVAHLKGEYERSNRYLDAAKRISKELYTELIREKLMTGLANDLRASYPGTDFEVGLIHYYLVLNHTLIAESGRIPAWSMPELKVKDQVVFAAEHFPEQILTAKQVRDSRVRARAEVLAWDSFLQEVRNRNKGKPYYKDDVLNKVIASQVHRLIGTREDQQTARILLKDAQDLLVKSLSAYPTYNQKYRDYIESYSDFERLGVDGVKAQFVQPTDRYQVLEQYAQGSSAQTPNLFVVIENGFVPLKREKTYTIGLSTLFSQIEDPQLRANVEAVGMHVLLELAPQLGLAAVGGVVVGAATSKTSDRDPKYMSDSIDNLIGFQFKLPTIPQVSTDIPFTLVAKSSNAEHRLELPILSPLNEIAFLNVERRAGDVALKTGIRVGMKYLAALVSAAVIYKQLESKPPFIRLMAAGGSYLAAKKIIDASEAADTRMWSLLPLGIQAGGLRLPEGLYRVWVESQRGDQPIRVDLGQVDLTNKKRAFLKSRTFQ